MKFTKIKYENLKSRQQEVYNFHKVAALMADYGFNCIKLTDDWEGADFLAYRMVSSGETETLKVQLKGRITIEKKYLGKNIWMAFQANDAWYLVEHDLLIEKVRVLTNWLNTKSWKQGGGYSANLPNAQLMSSLSEDRL